MAASAQPLTTLLDAARAGHSGAFDRVFAQVYDELRRLAHVVRQGRGATVNTTALVHEAYMKMAGADALAAENRLHFMRIAARAMRQVLVNAAERRTAAKRGGGQVDVTFEEQLGAGAVDAGDLLALHDALTRAGGDRHSAGAGRRVPLLRRVDDRGDSRRAGRLGADGQPGMAHGPRLARP